MDILVQSLWKKLRPVIVPVFMAACVFVPVFMLEACAFFRPTVEVEVVIPSGPWEEAGAPVFHVLRYPTPAGQSPESLRVPAGMDRVVIRLPRGAVVPVLAYPMGRLRPVGEILRTAAVARLFHRPILELTDLAGAGAEIFMDLLREQDRCETVNFRALMEAMEEKGAGDPWACDAERIMQALLVGTLGLLQVRRMESFSCFLSLPAEDWLAGNGLFRGDFTVAEEETFAADLSSGWVSLEFSGLYPGTHRFFSPRTGRELHIYVEKNGDCRSVLGSLQDFEERF